MSCELLHKFMRKVGLVMHGKPGPKPGVERKILLAREMAFVQCYVQTNNKSEAYREAG